MVIPEVPTKGIEVSNLFPSLPSGVETTLSSLFSTTTSSAPGLGSRAGEASFHEVAGSVPVGYQYRGHFRCEISVVKSKGSSMGFKKT